jgi:hypothetical protein
LKRRSDFSYSLLNSNTSAISHCTDSTWALKLLSIACHPCFCSSTEFWDSAWKVSLTRVPSLVSLK